MVVVMEITAAFKHRAQAQRAVDALLESGFSPGDVRLDWAEHAHEAFADDPQAPIAATVGGPRPLALGGAGGAIAAAAAGWAFGLTKGNWWRMLPLALAGLALGGGGAAAYGYMTRPGQLWGPPMGGGAGYSEGSLERGHAVVTVATEGRILEVEDLLRSFGGRAVHLRGDPASSREAMPAVH